MIKKILHIVIGWAKAKGVIEITPAEKKLSEVRLRICGKCPFSVQSRILKLMNGEAKYEHQLQCSRCGCPCLEKSLVVDEKCPVERW